jgi:hypothetical protein
MRTRRPRGVNNTKRRLAYYGTARRKSKKGKQRAPTRVYYRAKYRMKMKGGMNKYNISAGILSHYAPKTLANTLQTYKDSGFLDKIDDIFVVIQMSDRQKEEEEVCKKYGIRCILLPDNGQMASGFKCIYENAKHDIILFLENDFIIKNKDDIDNFLINAIYFLEENMCDMVRGRSRDNAGDPNYAGVIFSSLTPEQIKESIYLSERIFFDPHPDKTYPDRITLITPKTGDKPWYKSSSRYCNYTNNPCMYKKQFFKNEILPHLIAGENIESRMTSIWSAKDYRCVFGPGLFTHDRSFDGKY